MENEEDGEEEYDEEEEEAQEEHRVLEEIEGSKHFDGSPMDDDVDYDALANDAEAAETLAASTLRPYAADTWTNQ